MQRRRHLTRDELVDAVVAARMNEPDGDQAGAEPYAAVLRRHVQADLDTLAALGVDLGQLVKMLVDEPDPTVHGAG